MGQVGGQLGLLGGTLQVVARLVGAETGMRESFRDGVYQEGRGGRETERYFIWTSLG